MVIGRQCKISRKIGYIKPGPQMGNAGFCRQKHEVSFERVSEKLCFEDIGVRGNLWGLTLFPSPEPTFFSKNAEFLATLFTDIAFYKMFLSIIFTDIVIRKMPLWQ